MSEKRKGIPRSIWKKIYHSAWTQGILILLIIALVCAGMIAAINHARDENLKAAKPVAARVLERCEDVSDGKRDFLYCLADAGYLIAFDDWTLDVLLEAADG